ncbi:MAG TPA: ThuA domain-containing protein [Bacteroidia bacterium]|nr:ThuA domain-containing protein [Bacteroidia bacterium]
MPHRWIFFLTFFLTGSACFSQDTIRVLHYTEVTGFNHSTQTVSKNFFERICDTLTATTPHVWLLTDSDSSETFDNLSALQQYKVVIWANTSGASGLTPAQRQNYELYVNSGGSYLGVHAASDTYRHSTANGTNTGAWDFYAENMAGCSVQENPNHTAANHNNDMNHVAVHPILNGLPNPWNKTEEYYYWENGFLDTSFTELLRVNATGINPYDSARMTAHCKEHAWGSRSFYTSLGHDVSNYTSDAEFELLLRNALYWTANPVPSGVAETEYGVIMVYPNPFFQTLTITSTSNEPSQITICNTLGQIVYAEEFLQSATIDLSFLSSGIYCVAIINRKEVRTQRVIKEESVH